MQMIDDRKKKAASKAEDRATIKAAMENYNKPVRVVTKEDELWELAGGDYTEFSMRCGELGIIPGYQGD